MKPTLTLIADWCTLLMNGYPPAAVDYRRDPSAMNQRCLDALVVLLHNLAEAMPALLPEVWPELRLVAPGALWHADPQFDWHAAERELRLIQAAARVAGGQGGSTKTPVEPEPDSGRTMPMTIQRAADLTGWSASTIRRKLRDHDLDVIDTEDGKHLFLQSQLDQLKTAKDAQRRRLGK